MRIHELTRSARSKKWAVVLCLTALAALLCIQAFHTHLGHSSFSDQTHCSLCAAIHSASVALFVGFLLLTAPPIPRRFVRSLLDFRPESQITEFGLFSRPPPSR